MSIKFTWLCGRCGKVQTTNEGSKVIKPGGRSLRICAACLAKSKVSQPS